MFFHHLQSRNHAGSITVISFTKIWVKWPKIWVTFLFPWQYPTGVFTPGQGDSSVFQERGIFWYRRSSELVGLCWWTCVKCGAGTKGGWMLVVGTTMWELCFGWEAQFRSEYQWASLCGKEWSQSVVAVRGDVFPRSRANVSQLGPRAQESRGGHGALCTHGPATRCCPVLPGQRGAAEVEAEGSTGSAGSRPQPLRPVPLSARRPPCRRGGGSGRREERHRHRHRVVRGQPCRAEGGMEWELNLLLYLALFLLLLLLLLLLLCLLLRQLRGSAGSAPGAPPRRRPPPRQPWAACRELWAARRRRRLRSPRRWVRRFSRRREAGRDGGPPPGYWRRFTAFLGMAPAARAPPLLLCPVPPLKRSPATALWTPSPSGAGTFATQNSGEICRWARPAASTL